MTTEDHIDILILGATGYTGRLILRYLAAHPSRQSRTEGFTIALGGRSLARLKQAADECGLQKDEETTLRVIEDMNDIDEVRSLIADVRVVISAVGPFWRYGKTLVRACAELGVHYVDITGETHFVKWYIDKYDYLASKTHAVLISSAGFDSTPSDLSAFLGVQALKSFLGKDTQAGQSTSAFLISGSGFSGGTTATMLDVMSGGVPMEVLAEANSEPWLLSPIQGALPVRDPTLTSHLPFTSIVGGIFLMAGVNTHIVRRSWGLRKRQALEQKEDSDEAYGDEFDYYEFQQTGSSFAALALSLALIAGAVLMFIPPTRWLAKKWLFWQPGQGPNVEELEKGRLELTNVTTTAKTGPEPTRAVKTIIKADCEPGYLGTSIITSEIALGLLPRNRERLTRMGKAGGALTPTAAFGMELKERLEKTGRFTFQSELIEAAKP